MTVSSDKPTWHGKAAARVAETKRIAVGSDVHLLEMALAERKSLLALIATGEATVADLLKSTGGAIICQDYGRLNDFLIKAKRASR